MAAKQFNFHGNTQELDQASPTDPSARLAVIDTDEFAQKENLSAEDKALVERRLMEVCQATPGDLFMVTSKPVEAPFPRYDSFDGDPEQLAVKLAEDGFDLEQVLYYEQSFGPNRPEVVEALQTLIGLEQEQTVSA